MRRSAPLAVFTSLASATPYHRSNNYHQATNSCAIIFDGRVPSTASLTDFDTASGGGWNPFNPEYVKGNGLAWSDILLLPTPASPSRFDAAAGSVPVEVTISDASIFQKQNGFRRAGLQFNKDNNEDSPGSEGVVTLHFSVLQDKSRPLNLTHEYLNVWHEAADYSANQFNFEAGTLIGSENLPRDTYKLLDRNNKLIWSTPILADSWQNFAITLDFDKNTIQAWYSHGNTALRPVTRPVSNDNSGRGQYQIGILKKPTGTDDVVNSGYQENGLDEGLIYSGIFIENSSNQCISK
ncbi:hypothetical protein B0J13DRAFT_678476 [Dactylonectria estremocensis]|uniref:Glycoside hydrolase 131 catalytic N-terminal domain-containing protein n=1 Tax=Dactylonectria estremocensis TaxID=1079267 RepID=A0A9P9IWE4_9HYPO|nr:hypothetical protein B0J13DRAFT_678476 [Dactylonectria estremocensis]